jgi:carbon-monoxide dehydrogenase medium subunit
LAGINYEREVPIENFFKSVGETTLAAHEIVTEISIPGLPPKTGGAFMKLTQGSEGCAKVNVAVLVTMQKDKCEAARIAIGSCAPTTLRAFEAESIIKGNAVTDESIALAAVSAACATSPISDVRSTLEYRKKMVIHLVKTALKTAAERAQG